MDVIFLAFANNRQNPLPSLREEDEQAYAILSRRMAEKHFMIHRDSYATLPKIAESLILHRENVSVFLYSGHAGRDQLLLEDQEANALGIARLLGRCPKLRLVILNGCSTAAQVERLLDLGVPAVIGTSAPVDDHTAAHFCIRFFQAFSENRERIGDAFQSALAAAQSATAATITVDTARGLRGAGQRPAWGLFTREGNESATEWTLPDRSYRPVDEVYHPNARLIEAMTRALAPYNEKLAEILAEEEAGGDPSAADQQKAILESLPHPISEQLRKLLAPKDDNSEHVFFDKLSPERLQQLTVAYNTFIEFLAFIMLGQLWDAASEHKDLRIAPERLDELHRFFRLKKAERETYDFIRLIRYVRLTFDDNSIPYFVSELQGLQQVFHEQSDFFYACMFLETLKARLPQQDMDREEAVRLCITAEDKLAVVLGEIGFLANYTLASVKEVGVLKYRHRKEISFRHKLVKLVQKFVKLAEEQKIFRDTLDTASVVLLKNEKTGLAYLNLSPFVIDENAFEDRTGDVSKLHFFERYEQSMDVLLFRHVYKPTDELLYVEKQKEYRILKEQFDVFSELLFKKPMKAL